MVVHIIPHSALWQIDFPCLRPFFHHVCHQHRRSEQKGQMFVCVAVFILRKLQKQRPHHRHTVFVRFPHKRIQIRYHAISLGICSLYIRQGFLVHKRLCYRIVAVCGIDTESRLENTVLNPAKKKFCLRSRTCKTADITAGIGNTGHSHAHNGGNVKFHRTPVCQIISVPNLSITLDSCESGPVNNVGTFFRIYLSQGFLCRISHHIGMNNFQLCHGSAHALKFTERISVLNAVILTVVVPYRLGTFFQQRFLS